MSNEPLVSVLMTAYNRQGFIVEAIESVLASTYTNFELIIVDDCSMDNTVSIARSYEQKDNRIKVYVNDKNLGDYPNRNKAACYANGEFIMYLDSDDTIFKDGIENCVDAILTYPNSNFGMYNTLGEKEVYKLESEKALKMHLLKTPFLMTGPGGTIIRREFFKKIHGYPEKYGPANDMYFNLKASCKTDIIMMPSEVGFYRRHEGQEVNNHFSYLHNNYCYQRDALNELDLPVNKKELKWLHKKNNRRFLVNILKYFIRTHNLSKTKELFNITGFGFRDIVTGIFH